MALDVNGQINSQYSNTQVIQSIQNRRRINEQQEREQAEGSNYEQLQKEDAAVSYAPEIKKSDSNFERIYEDARRMYGADSSSSRGAAAYSAVQNQSSRDSLQETLGISVYA